jgi:hypothetical protein
MVGPMCRIADSDRAILCDVTRRREPVLLHLSQWHVFDKWLHDAACSTVVSRADSVVYRENFSTSSKASSVPSQPEPWTSMGRHAKPPKQQFCQMMYIVTPQQQSGSKTTPNHYVPAVMTGSNCSAHCTNATPCATHATCCMWTACTSNPGINICQTKGSL